jgi:hypothetical protein
MHGKLRWVWYEDPCWHPPTLSLLYELTHLSVKNLADLCQSQPIPIIVVVPQCPPNRSLGFLEATEAAVLKLPEQQTCALLWTRSKQDYYHILLLYWNLYCKPVSLAISFFWSIVLPLDHLDNTDFYDLFWSQMALFIDKTSIYPKPSW